MSLNHPHSSDKPHDNLQRIDGDDRNPMKHDTPMATIQLPESPTDSMLLDLAVSHAWGDGIIGESRDDYIAAYRRLLAQLPPCEQCYVTAPVEPSEGMLLAIADCDIFHHDVNHDVSIDFELTYEGYIAMVANLISPERIACTNASGQRLAVAIRSS
jgi:hypothetical protein